MMNTVKELPQKPVPPEGSCHFFVERKKRFCRFHPAKNSNYCAEHTTLFEPDNGKKRVLCPYNPKHTCYENKLNHHMKKCPSRPMEMPPYYCEGINSGDDAGEVVPEPKATVLSEPLDVIESIIAKVERLHQEHIGNIVEDILSHPCLNEELNKKEYGTSALRQRKQQASLIGQMEKSGMLKDGTCFLEMGAGKGQMSHWLHAAVQDKKNIGFVLIERSHVRNKMDNLHKEEDAGHVMERVRIDIEHLKLDRIKTIEDHDRQVVAFGKHLCGGATDLALRCVVETLGKSCVENKLEDDSEGSQRKRLKSDTKCLSGVAIAVCCHHRCAWTPYVGKSFFKANGLTARDFQIISSMSSWATCAWKGWSYQKKYGKGQNSGDKDSDKTSDSAQNNGNHVAPVSDNGNGLVPNSDYDNCVVPTSDNCNHAVQNCGNVNLKRTKHAENENSVKEDGKSDIEMIVDGKSDVPDIGKGSESEKSCVTVDHESVEEDHRPTANMINNRIQDKLSQEEREKIGRKCKQLIDYGRVQYLIDNDMTSCLKIYIEEFYTPENVVLLATS